MHDTQGNCPYDDTDTDEHYLAGTLSHTEADAFERHYFECDGCWARVQRGLEIKAALADTPVVGIGSARSSASHRPARRQRATRWATPLAAAAVLVLGFGIWHYRGPADFTRVGESAPDTVQVMRGSARNIAVSSHQTGSMLIAAWAPAASASSYRVRLLSPDGALLYERETPDTSIVLPEDSAGVSPDAAYWEIQALNELRNVIAVSPLTPATAGARH